MKQKFEDLMLPDERKRIGADIELTHEAEPR